MTTSEEMRQGINAIKDLFYVRHLRGSSVYTPRNFASWKEYWEDKKGAKFPTEETRCDCCGEETEPEDFVGAHVINVYTEDKYICPLCQTCNDKYGKNKLPSPYFWVKKDSCVDFLMSETKIVEKPDE